MDAFLFQLLEVTVISGQPLDDRLGYIACLNERSSIPGLSNQQPLAAAVPTFVEKVNLL